MGISWRCVRMSALLARIIHELVATFARTWFADGRHVHVLATVCGPIPKLMNHPGLSGVVSANSRECVSLSSFLHSKEIDQRVSP